MVIVNGTVDGKPGRLGTVTVHDVCVGQMVGAGCPPKRARTSPFGLKKFEPWTSTTVPTAPRDGLTEESRGALPGGTVAVTVVGGVVTVAGGAVTVAGGVVTVAGTVVVGAPGWVVGFVEVACGCVEDELVDRGARDDAGALGRPGPPLDCREEPGCSAETRATVPIPRRTRIARATSAPSLSRR